MNRRQKIIVSVTGIFLVLLILVGLTYAYFLTQIQGNEEEKSITVTTANLVLEYGDGNGILEIDKLEPSNDFIKFKDSEGNLVDSKIFTVTNKGNATVEGYKVYLEKVQNQLVRKDDLVYTLTCTSYANYGETNQTELETGCNGVETETTFPDVITSIVSNDIAEGTTHFYELKLKYKEMNTDQSIDMNKLITAKVNIYGGETKFLASEIINNARNNLNGTTLDLTQETLPRVANEISRYEIGKTSPIVYSQTKTDLKNHYIAYACDYSFNESSFKLGTDECPVKYININEYSSELASELAGKFAYLSTSEITNTTKLRNLFKITTDESKITNDSLSYMTVNRYVSTEKVLSTDYDDYGTSYYFRGGVEDNYVNFADMCWRIVRIEGDGSVKLILEDQDQLCDSKDTNGNLNMEGNWNIPVSKEEGASITGNYGYTNQNDRRYISNYLNRDGLAENYDNSMGTAFKNFQETFATKELSNMKSGNWCMEDKAYSQNGSSPNYTYSLLTEEEIQAKRANNESIYYDSYVRLWGANIKRPTLKCNGIIINKWGDNTIPMFVGTLTEDEILYSGVNLNGVNEVYYLLNDYQRTRGLMWWSLTNDIDGGVFLVQPRLTVVGAIINQLASFRPSISLVSSTIITGGDGTIENPYVIE